MSDPVPAQQQNDKWRTIALVLLPLIGILLVVFGIFVMRSGDSGVVVALEPAGKAVINTGQVIDATDPSKRVQAQVGYRYKVVIEDESEDRGSGITRIGGRNTFVTNARRGQVAVVSVTRIDRVVNATLEQVLGTQEVGPRSMSGYVPLPGDTAGHVIDGAEMDVVISAASDKNPDTEGVAKVNGLVVFVEGVTTIGERVNVRITERRERMAFAEPTGKPAGTGPLTAPAAARSAYQPKPGDSAAHVVPGAEMDVVISEASSKNPDTEGVAKVKGLVVFVKGATTIGERVNVRITDRRERMAFAELTGKPAGTGPLETKSSGFRPKAGDATAHIVDGAEMDVIITDASEVNPYLEGIAMVFGLPITVEDATEVGERYNIRIINRQADRASAVLTGRDAGKQPLATEMKPAAPKKAYQPKSGDSAAHVVPGAELDVVITEASTKNPDTEGVARVKGLVVFVNGTTTPGERVNVRITDRRERMAFAEPTGKPVGSRPILADELPPPEVRPSTPKATEPAQVGEELDVVITESSMNNPGVEGVARVDGLVVFVRGATEIGQTVKVRVLERRARSAVAEVIPSAAATTAEAE